MIRAASSGMNRVERAPVINRHPIRIGQLLPEVLARYGMQEARATSPAQRRPAPMAAVRLGQQTLAGLAEV